jgi:hypothetical protein
MGKNENRINEYCVYVYKVRIFLPSQAITHVKTIFKKKVRSE